MSFTIEDIKEKVKEFITAVSDAFSDSSALTSWGLAFMLFLIPKIMIASGITDAKVPIYNNANPLIWIWKGIVYFMSVVMPALAALLASGVSISKSYKFLSKEINKVLNTKENKDE